MMDFLLWNLIGFLVQPIYGSFFEWTLHRFVMHKRQKLLPFPYELHAVQHHSLFGADASYHAAEGDPRLEHVDFVPRDYILLLIANAPIYLAVEFVTGLPVAFGASLATLAYLQAFNSLHNRFHVPKDTWFQRTWFFRFLKRHHLLHHEGANRQNWNVVLPVADFVFRSLRTKPINAERVMKV
jgi:hypothetical protein